MNVAIIGAGITGLSAARELLSKGHQVTIFEASPVPGGLGTYHKIQGNYIEAFYHHFFSSDQEIISLAQDLGIGNKLQFYSAKTGIFIHEKIYPFNSISSLLQFTALPFIDRLRCGLLIGFFKCIIFPPRQLDSISATQLVKNVAGEKVYSTVWEPLLTGKFAEYAKNIPALWLWGRVKDRSLKLGYFDGSVKILFDKLIDKLQKKNCKIFLATPIISAEQTEGEVILKTQTKTYTFDTVIFTTVSPITEKIITKGIKPKLRKQLAAIDQLGAVCVILELKHSVQSQYWLNICEKNAPVLVAVEHTNMIDKKYYGGRTIMYLANYLHRTSKRFQQTDDQILTEYTSLLSQINSTFKKSWILKSYVNRVPRAQTIFGLHSLTTKPPMKLGERIYMANIDHMYPHDRNLNQGIQLGKKVVTELLDNIE